MIDTSHTTVYGDFATKVLCISNDIQAIMTEARALESAEMTPEQFTRYCELG